MSRRRSLARNRLFSVKALIHANAAVPSLDLLLDRPVPSAVWRCCSADRKDRHLPERTLAAASSTLQNRRGRFQDAEQNSRTSRDAGHHTVGYSRWRNARRWRIDLPAGRQNDVAKYCVADPDYGCTASCPAIAFRRMTSAISVSISTFDSSRTACRNVTKPDRVSNAGPESSVAV